MEILVIEDETKIARTLTQQLRRAGYGVTAAASAEEGFYALSTTAFNLVILDLMLPGRDGFQLLRDLRARQDRTPVLILTARDSVEDRVKGLDLGADDYLVKPFALPELLARIRVIERRGQPGDPLLLIAEDLSVDLAARKVHRAGRQIELSRQEFRILVCLLQAKGQVVTRATLSREIWGETDRILDNSIDVYLSYLRRKIDGGFNLKLIHTLRGVGFQLRA